jgi:WD40 repeat protein
LRNLLTSPEWLQAKLVATDVTSLTSDFDFQPDDDGLRLLQGAVRLSSSVIAKDPGQFVSQIVGRLLTYQDLPTIELFTKRVVAGTRTAWLRPLHPALHPPGTGLLRTLSGHTNSVRAVAVTPDGKRALSASKDHTLKMWDLGSGRELCTLEGHSHEFSRATKSRPFRSS